MKSFKNKIATSVLISSMVLPTLSPVMSSLAATPASNTAVATGAQTAVAKPVTTRGYAVENTTTIDLGQMKNGAGTTSLPDGFTFNYKKSKDGVSSSGYIMDPSGSSLNDNISLLGDGNYLQANTSMQYFVKVNNVWHLRALKFINTQVTTGTKNFYFDTTAISQSAINDGYDTTIKQTIVPGVNVSINATASKSIVQTATVEYSITLTGSNVPDFDLNGNNNHNGYVTSNGYTGLNQDTTYTFSYFNEQGKMMTGVLHFKKEDVKPAAKPVTVNYVDQSGQSVATSTTLTGNLGASYQAVAKSVTGYQLIATPVNAKGIFSDQAQTVNFVYKKTTTTPEIAQPVTVKYVDEQGKMIAPNETLTGKLNATYQTTAKTIAGYDLVKTPANATGQYSAQAQTVVYMYHKKAVTNTSVTVTAQYVDEQGKALLPSISKTGHTGDVYEAKAPTISGYQLVSIPANAKGTLGTEPVNIKFIYRKITNHNQNNNDQNGANNTDHSTAKPNTKPTQTKTGHVTTTPVKKAILAKTNKKKLPQTSTQSTLLMTLAGSLLVLAAGVLTFFKKEKQY